jgi:hypothetical protein
MLRDLTLSCALVGLLACGDDAAGPSADDGVYALRQLNGSPLPYDHEGLGCCIYLSGGLELDRGHYEIGVTFENRNNGQVATIREWGTYTRPGPARLGFARDSFLLAPFLMDVATVSLDTIRVAWGGEGPGSPDQFQALYVRGP